MVAEFVGKITRVAGPFEKADGSKSVRLTVFDGVETTDIFMSQADQIAKKYVQGGEFRERCEVRAWRDKLQVGLLGGAAA